MSTAVDTYRALCASERSIPLFCTAAWLDATAGTGGWDVALVERGGSVVAALPYAIRTRFGFKSLGMPALTQFLGPWLRYPAGQKRHTRLSFEKEMLGELIERLPAYDHFQQSFHYSQTNWLPFYWAGFRETTRYTYVLDDIRNPTAVFGEFRSNIKTDIRKAQKVVRVSTTEDVDKFYRINQRTFDRQQQAIPYDLAYVRRLDAAVRDRRRILLAEDERGAIHAGIYLVWDDMSAYYVMGGGDPALRSSGATSLLVWEAIQFASTVTQRFDFEGSMMEPVERFFRAFGARQQPYFSVSKAATKRMQLRLLVEEAVGLR